MNKRILLYGNCQVQPLAAVLKEMLPCALTHVLPPNFMLMDGSRSLSDEDNEFIASLEDSDIAVYQPLDQIHHDFSLKSIIGHLTSSELAYVRIPYIVFKAYFPDAYSPNLSSQPEGGESVLVNPFGMFPYGHHWVDELKDNCNITEPGLTSILFEHLASRCKEVDFGRAVVDTIKILQGKELDCDILISDFILDNYQRTRLFHTYNHPSIEVFVELAKRLITLLEHEGSQLPPEKVDSLSAATFNDQQLPIFPFVAEALGLTFDCHNIVWRGYGTITLDAYLREYFKKCLWRGMPLGGNNDNCAILEKISRVRSYLTNSVSKEI